MYVIFNIYICNIHVICHVYKSHFTCSGHKSVMTGGHDWGNAGWIPRKARKVWSRDPGGGTIHWLQVQKTENRFLYFCNNKKRCRKFVAMLEEWNKLLDPICVSLCKYDRCLSNLQIWEMGEQMRNTTTATKDNYFDADNEKPTLKESSFAWE